MNKRKSTINLRLFHAKKIRKRKRANKKQKRINLTRNSRRKIKYKRERPLYKKQYLQESSVTFVLPERFSLLTYPNDVIKFINKVDRSIKRKRVRLIKFELAYIKYIDIGGICLLLSKLNELSRRNIRAWGTMPLNKECNDYIRNSGFLDRMRDMKTGSKFNKNGDNLLVNRGFEKTDNTTLGESIRKTVKFLTGEEDTYKPIYTISQEICANSVEHANDNSQKKNWLSSISFEGNDVIFTMTDIGEGTFSTIERKFLDKVADVNKNKSMVLLNAFLGKYQSRTGDVNRNKGLPKIYETSKNNYITNLKVITNNVFLDFDNIEDVETDSNLKENFNGTFYYWRLNKECIERWKTRLN